MKVHAPQKLSLETNAGSPQTVFIFYLRDSKLKVKNTWGFNLKSKYFLLQENNSDSTGCKMFYFIWNWHIRSKLLTLSSKFFEKGCVMFAVVNIAGQQFKVEESGKYYVPRLKEDPDSEVSFGEVLLFSDDKAVKVGSPFVDKLKVTAKVLEHVKDGKVIIFKKKRRTNYQKKNGHRQQLTRIEITSIG